MMSLWITLSFITLLTGAMLFYMYRTVRANKKVFALIGGLFIFVLSIGCYFNPDLLHWYSYLKQEKALDKAKAILAEPRKIAMLKIRLQEVVKLHPEDAKAWFLLGRLWAAENNWRHASQALKHSYELNPNDLKTAIFYAESLIKVEQHLTPKSRHVLLGILKQDENQPDALLMLAEDANVRQCPQEAIGYWKRVLIQLPHDTEMYEALDKAISKAQLQKSKDCIKVEDESF